MSHQTHYLHDENENGVDESALGVLVAPFLCAVRHAIDADDVGHGWRKVYDVLAWIPQSCLYQNILAQGRVVSPQLVSLANNFRERRLYSHPSSMAKMSGSERRTERPHMMTMCNIAQVNRAEEWNWPPPLDAPPRRPPPPPPPPVAE